MKEYIDQDLIKTNKIEKRLYQVNIFEEIKDRNSLVVLPTGLGKTIIAILALAYKLSQGKKVFFLAPTKPLCEQHFSSIKKITTLQDQDIAIVTGETYTPKKRKEIYNKARLIVATPQTIDNDINKNLVLDDYGLIIFDEAHRTVGDYAYVKIMEKYSTIPGYQVLGLTASPGSDYEKLKEVAVYLGLKHIEVRNEWDDDVRPYLSSRFLGWELIEMPNEIKQVVTKTDIILQEQIKGLQKFSSQAKNLTPNKLSKKALVEIQNRMRRNIGKRGGTLFHGLSLVSTAIKLSHLKDMLSSQGVDVAKTYISKLEDDDSRAAKKIKKHPLYLDIREGIDIIKGPQPKLERTKEIIKQHFQEKKDARIMVFAEYRDTVDMLVTNLEAIDGVKPVKFIGQTQKGGEKGMNQSEQKQTLDAFRKGEYNILVSTSIGEEGIDIPITSLVLFYEPVPSAIRHIQRKGRTARDGLPGEVRILIMKDSRDEGYYWSSTKKEKTMYRYVYRLKNRLEGNKVAKRAIERQSKIEEFLSSLF